MTKVSLAKKSIIYIERDSSSERLDGKDKKRDRERERFIRQFISQHVPLDSLDISPTPNQTEKCERVHCSLQLLFGFPINLNNGSSQIQFYG
jgi:hypothetical protein